MSAIATSVLRVSLGALTLGPRADICNVVAEHWRKLMEQVFDSYRPELHYMRGPGPKWHEKHAAAEERGHPSLSDLGLRGGFNSVRRDP